MRKKFLSLNDEVAIADALRKVCTVDAGEELAVYAEDEGDATVAARLGNVTADQVASVRRRLLGNIQIRKSPDEHAAVADLRKQVDVLRSLVEAQARRIAELEAWRDSNRFIVDQLWLDRSAGAGHGL